MQKSISSHILETAMISMMRDKPNKKLFYPNKLNINIKLNLAVTEMLKPK